MPQTRQSTRKRGDAVSDGHKACTAIPKACGRGIYISAQRVITIQVAADALQVCSCSATCRAQASDDSEIKITCRAINCREAVTLRQINGRFEIDPVNAIHRGHVETQTCGATPMQDLVHIDIVCRLEG